MKAWKEKIPTDPEQYSDWSCDREDVINFIEQIISERDKEWQKEKSELEYKLYMKTDKMYQILTQLENCLHILGKIESQKEHYPTVQDYLDGDESLQAMWRSYRD